MEVINEKNGFIPTAGDSYSAGWKAMWKKFPEFLVISILFGVLTLPNVAFQLPAERFPWMLAPVFMFGLAYGLFITGPIQYSVNWVFLKGVRGEKIEVQDMFAVFRKNFWNAVGANVVVGLIVGFGLLMLIVPGIIFAVRLAFVPYLVMDQEMELTEALSKSWEMTKGYGWHIFFMGFIAFWVILLGLLAFFFGVIISAIWISAAFAAMYQAVVEEKGYFRDEITVAE
jgi:uncharacterized membrane protein